MRLKLRAVRTVRTAFLLVAAVAHAEDSFLGLAFGARPLALGGAYAAVADDAGAVLWNPAGLSQVTRPALTGSQNHLTFTDNAFAVAVALPAGRVGTFAAGAQHLAIENAALTRPVLDAGGNPVLDPTTGQPLVEIAGFGQENDATFLLGYGVALGTLRVGGAGKALVGKAGPVRGAGFGADAGVMLALPGRLTLGVAGEDLGSTRVDWRDGTRTTLLAAGRVGLAWRPAKGWLLTAEARSPLARLRATGGGGAEIVVADQLALRLGLDDGRVTGGAGFRMPLAGGEGFAAADYAFLAGGAFEDRNRLTLTVGF